MLCWRTYISLLCNVLRIQCRSYFMFHGMDANQPKSIFKFLPILSFTESYIYQVIILCDLLTIKYHFANVSNSIVLTKASLTQELLLLFLFCFVNKLCFQMSDVQLDTWNEKNLSKGSKNTTSAESTSDNVSANSQYLQEVP